MIKCRTSQEPANIKDMDIHPGMKLVGPYHLNHHVNFPCGRKPEYPEKTHDLRQSVDLYSFTRGFGLGHIEEDLLRIELAP